MTLTLSNHRPVPGPGYWDFRCLECDQPVTNHFRLPLGEFVFYIGGTIVVFAVVVLALIAWLT